MKRKRRASLLANTILLCVLVLEVIGLIGSTLAFYSTADTVKNVMTTKGSDVYLQEIFNKDDLWLPGETKEKQVYFGNKSESDQVIRFKVNVAWYENNGTPNNLLDDTLLDDGAGANWPAVDVGQYTPEPATINWTTAIVGADGDAATLDAGQLWTKIGDYFYYNQVLAAQSGASPTQTANVIDSVAFSTAISNDTHVGEYDFSDKRCAVTVEMEALDVIRATVEAAWPGITFTGAGSSIVWATTP